VLYPLVTKIASTLHSTFYPDYAEEMEGIAEGLGMDMGEVVLVNLIYQLEGIGTGCAIKNTTGPCPPKNGPALCTGFVANGQGDADPVWQGRNLDWNLDAKLLKYVMQVDFQKNNVTLFTGVQVAGMVGILHGVKKDAFSVQLNARDDGGNVLANLFEQILLGGKEPTHHMRKAFEQAADFKAAEAYLSQGHLANQCYYIMAGAKHGDGAILTRGRTSIVDSWHLNEAPAKDTKGINKQPDWFRLQTNYDHWTEVPSYDDRRTPGVANVAAFCGKEVSEDCVLKVMTTWPTKNFHTDVTSVICPKTGYLSTTVWLPSPSSSGSLLVV
jgi:hypothetical protein